MPVMFVAPLHLDPAPTSGKAAQSGTEPQTLKVNNRLGLPETKFIIISKSTTAKIQRKHSFFFVQKKDHVTQGSRILQKNAAEGIHMQVHILGSNILLLAAS